MLKLLVVWLASKGWGVQDYDHLWQKAEQVFGDKNKAAVWLSTPKPLFGGLTAIDYMRDQETLARVVEVLNQIEHGYAC